MIHPRSCALRVTISYPPSSYDLWLETGTVSIADVPIGIGLISVEVDPIIFEYIGLGVPR